MVSAAEELAYALQHPELKALGPGLDAYTQSGTLNAGAQGAGSSFSVHA